MQIQCIFSNTSFITKGKGDILTGTHLTYCLSLSLELRERWIQIMKHP